MNSNKNKSSKSISEVSTTPVLEEIPGLKLKNLFSLWALKSQDVLGQPKVKEIQNLSNDLKIEISKIWSYYRNKIDSQNEQYLKTNVLEKILGILGWNVHPEYNYQTGGELLKPDYLLFDNQELLSKCLQQPQEIMLSSAAIVLEAKAGDIVLDGQPDLQIIKYMLTSQIQWGILTNGHFWRLYSTKTRSKTTSYIEIHLDTLLAMDNETFFYFVLFFSKSSHEKMFGKDGISILDYLSNESNSKATEIERGLGKNVSEAISFYRDSIKCEKLSSEDITDFGFRFLIRILFILNMEARGYTKAIIDDAIYYQYSLTSLIKALCEPNKKFHRKFEIYSYIMTSFDILSYGEDFLEVNPLPESFYPQDLREFFGKNKIDNEPMESILKLIATKQDDGKTKKLIEFSSLSLEHLGDIFEHVLGESTNTEKDSLKTKKEKTIQKQSGTYYTPKYIVDHIVSQSLEKLCEYKDFKEISQIKILDPAMGTGHFLIGSLLYLQNLVLKNLKTNDNKFELNKDDITKILVENCLFGVDYSRTACEITKFAIWMNSASSIATPPCIDGHIICKNSLTTNSEDLFGESNCFDAVVGNPPYGADLTTEERVLLKKKYNLGSTDTAALFIKAALADFAKKDGVIGMIVPKALCFSDKWRETRNVISQSLLELIDCGTVWKSVKLEQVIIVLDKKNSDSYYLGLRVGSKFLTGPQLHKSYIEKSSVFLVNINSNDLIISRKMSINSIPLTGKEKCLIKNRACIATNVRGAPLSKYLGGLGHIEVIGGKEIERFRIKKTKGYINDSVLTPGELSQSKVCGGELLLQNICAHVQYPIPHIKIIAAIVPEVNADRFAIHETINIIKIQNTHLFDPLFILGILNSHLMNWYVYKFVICGAKRTIHMDNPVTSQIPIPLLDGSTDEVVESIKQKVLSIMDGNISQEQRKVIQKKLNHSVYKLYKLSDEDIEYLEKINPENSNSGGSIAA